MTKVNFTKINKQPYLPGIRIQKQSTFGGSRLKSNPKVQRAIPLDRPMHLVMRSQHTRGALSMKRHSRAARIYNIIVNQSQRFNVRIYSYANSGNHLHILVMPRSRRGYVGFIKAISGLIARLILQAERNSAKGIQFWDARPFTRIVLWGRDYKKTCEYLLQNTLEAFGFAPYRSRKGRLLASSTNSWPV